jgi:hypothetical protein
MVRAISTWIVDVYRIQIQLCKRANIAGNGEIIVPVERNTDANLLQHGRDGMRAWI